MMLVPSHVATSMLKPAFAPVSQISTPPLNQPAGAGIVGVELPKGEEKAHTCAIACFRHFVHAEATVRLVWAWMREKFSPLRRRFP
jgi:hypothetical protein